MDKPMDVEAAALSGDKRQTLIALRNNLARAIDACQSGRDSAALSKRLMEVMDELEAIPDQDSETMNPIQKQRERVAARNEKT